MKKYPTRSLATQLKFLTVTLSIGLSIFLFPFFYMQNKTFKETSTQYSKDFINQLEQAVYTNYDSLNNILYYLSFQDNVQELLLSSSDNNNFQLFKRVKNTLSNSLELNPHILNIIIEDSNSRLYSVFSSNYSLPELTDSTSKLSALQVNKNGQKYFILSTGVTQLHNSPSSDKVIGSLHLILDENAFTSSSAQTYKDATTTLFLADKDGKTFWCNQSGVPLTDFSINSKNASMLESTGLSLNYTIEFEENFEALYYSQLLLFLSLTLIFSVAAVVLNLFMRRIVNSLNDLTIFLATLQSGGLSNLKKSVELNGFSEIKVIGNEFNKMLEHIHTLTTQLFKTTSQLYEARLSKGEAELQYLRSQINPHFLYNTLDSITGLAAIHRLPDIMNLTKSLSNIFKYSIKGENEVPLKNRIKYCK